MEHWASLSFPRGLGSRPGERSLWGGEILGDSGTPSGLQLLIFMLNICQVCYLHFSNLGFASIPGFGPISDQTIESAFVT